MNNNTIIDSIEIRTQKPLELKRGPVDKPSDLYRLETWLTDTYTDDTGKTHTIVYAYEGMTVSVISSRELWMLLNPNDITNPDSWVRIGGVGVSDDNIIYDGGRAIESYTEEQKMDAGNAYGSGDPK